MQFGKVENSKVHQKDIKNKGTFVFDVYHDGRHKARLVADGHLTKEPLETVYSGDVSLRSFAFGHVPGRP